MLITHFLDWTLELNPKPLDPTHCTLRKNVIFNERKQFNSRFNLLQIGPWGFDSWTLV
jgi:hypothetical protein